MVPPRGSLKSEGEQDILDMLIVEQFIEVMLSGIRKWIQCHWPMDVTAAVTLAEDHLAAQGWEKRTEDFITSMNSSFYNHSVSSSLLYRGTTSTIVTVIVVALGIIINYINGTLVHTFRKHQIFYMNPRYILYIHLVLNDTIYLFTSVSMFVFSYTLYNMSVSLCCLFIVVALFTSHNTPLNLALMAVECYIAVCFPLRYAEFCTNKRIYIVIGCVWVFSSLSFMTDMFFYLAKDPFWLFNSIPICNKDKLFSHPVSVQKEEIIYLLYLTIVWFTLIFTYLKIYFAAQAANSANSEQKARNTILLHGFQLLLSMLTYGCQSHCVRVTRQDV
ncbi:olfactory receptor 2M3-like [Nothobranchius furzeri]|uniref:Olfactory receptor 2M3-like n=1 Tax=Nothobranchius furzeri TaxID=105023 RepID=A0A9D2XUN9_NOTFU|nr:olfactory receptor 2M3-like [Nothobranchius furzeri]